MGESDNKKLDYIKTDSIRAVVLFINENNIKKDDILLLVNNNSTKDGYMLLFYTEE